MHTDSLHLRAVPCRCGPGMAKACSAHQQALIEHGKNVCMYQIIGLLFLSLVNVVHAGCARGRLHNTVDAGTRLDYIKLL